MFSGCRRHWLPAVIFRRFTAFVIYGVFIIDIYARLKQDHDKQRQLAKQIMDTHGDSEERRQLWAQFKPEATAHANAEEQSFYAALIAEPECQEQARHSVSEHKEADDLIEELHQLDMGTGEWIQKFEKLKDELEHHMDEEENDVFSQARAVIDPQEAERLAFVFDSRKQSELGESS